MKPHIIVEVLAAYRAWRTAQCAYAQALKDEDAEQIAAAEERLQTARQEYEKYNPQHTTHKGAQP